jgi:hypothetical protein
MGEIEIASSMLGLPLYGPKSSLIYNLRHSGFFSPGNFALNRKNWHFV